MGHQMLGDVVGFVAAAHLYSEKTKTPTKVYFQKTRKDIIQYFDGVEFVTDDEFMNARSKIDCGIDPPLELWPQMNGVKRFYRFMDPTLSSPKSFDIHFNIKKNHQINNLIGLITHSNTQGDIPNKVVDEIISITKKEYPDHKIIAIGNMDNKYIPKGISDQRIKTDSIHPIISTISKLDLLIAPQTGPCFIAAGFRVPMWIYKSKHPCFDYVLNYDNHKVSRWFERQS
jgi:hypothetical protein